MTIPNSVHKNKSKLWWRRDVMLFFKRYILCFSSQPTILKKSERMQGSFLHSEERHETITVMFEMQIWCLRRVPRISAATRNPQFPKIGNWKFAQKQSTLKEQDSRITAKLSCITSKWVQLLN